jgi:hypothetical protein
MSTMEKMSAWWGATSGAASPLTRLTWRLSPGELIIPAGSKLGPAEIGLLATVGVVEVPPLLTSNR